MNILLVIGGIIAAFVVFTILKKLIKMMFVFIVILALGLGALFFMYQNNPALFSAQEASLDADSPTKDAQILSIEDQQQLLQATEELRQKAAEEVNKAVQDATQIMQEGIENRGPRPSQEQSTEKTQE